MTSLNPSHFPFHNDNPREGQAVISSVEPFHDHDEGVRKTEDEDDAEEAEAEADEVPRAGPSWRGAWERRMEAKKKQKKERERSARRRGQIPTPQLPDLRYEQGVMASLRPFIHSDKSSSGTGGEVSVTTSSEKRLAAERKGAMVSSNVTAEGGDVFSNQVSIDYLQITYILFRDQVVWPLLQGLLWGAGGLFLSWAWNRQTSRGALKAERPNRSPLSSWAKRVAR